MNIKALAAAIARGRVNGVVPLVIIATGETINTGSINPLPACADLAAKEALWSQMDGCYGAIAVPLNSHRELISGIECADSISWDLQNWLF